MKKTTMNKMMKIITVLIMIAMVISMISTVVFATPDETLKSLTGNTGAAGGITTTANNIIGVVQVICYAAAVVMLVILGVKFITASPEGKAEIKKSAIQYVIGAIIVFAAGTLLGIISNVSNSAIVNK